VYKILKLTKTILYFKGSDCCTLTTIIILISNKCTTIIILISNKNHSIHLFPSPSPERPFFNLQKPCASSRRGPSLAGSQTKGFLRPPWTHLGFSYIFFSQYRICYGLRAVSPLCLSSGTHHNPFAIGCGFYWFHSNLTSICVLAFDGVWKFWNSFLSHPSWNINKLWQESHAYSFDRCRAHQKIKVRMRENLKNGQNA
jgi:hypothetical protein